MADTPQEPIDVARSRLELAPDNVIVVHNYYYAKPGQQDAVYQWRLHASDVRARLGFPPGRVLRRLGDSDTQPDVIWECTYPDLAARQRDVRAVEATAEFQAVMQHMRTLINRFERQLWQHKASR